MRISDNWKTNAVFEFAIAAGSTTVFYLLGYNSMFYLGLILTFFVTPSRAVRNFHQNQIAKEKKGKPNE